MDLAIIKDINKEYIEAVKLYEDSINEGCATLTTYTNLAFLYWEFAAEQVSFNQPNNISDEWSIIGGKRYAEIIEMGLVKFPDSLELKFWKKYFPYRLYYDEFTQQECEQMISAHRREHSLIPYFYLYLFDQEKYKSERNKLLEICQSNPTAKFNYIKSIIE